MKQSRILIVEDDKSLRIVLASQLEALGHRGDCAADALDALRKLEHERYALILMDVSMPDMDGLELVKKIRTREKEKQSQAMPIIAVTGCAEKPDCLEAGMNDYVQKPLLRNDLERILRTWLPACECCD